MYSMSWRAYKLGLRGRDGVWRLEFTTGLPAAFWALVAGTGVGAQGRTVRIALDLNSTASL